MYKLTQLFKHTIGLCCTRLVLLPVALLPLMLFALFTMPVHAQDTDTSATTDATTTAEDAETFVQGCAECHIDIVADWQDSSHATTFHTADFQSVWQAGDAATETCLACHATGFVAFSGEYTHEGVTCEACHGQTPENHPDEPISVLPGLDVCADCHTITYREWQSSPHGNADMPCTSCHNPHPQQVRFGDTNTLCLNCHEQDERNDYVHVTHTESECTSCHWHRGVFDADVHLVSGELMPTGHDASVETLACIDCHENLGDDVLMAEATPEVGERDEMQDDTHGVAVADANMRPPTGLAAQVEIQELQAEVQSVQALGENTAAVRLMQGLVVGLALGAVVVWLLARLRPGQMVAPHDQQTHE